LKREALILPVRKETSRASIPIAKVAIAFAVVLAVQLSCGRAGEDPPAREPDAPLEFASAPPFVTLEQLEDELAKFRGRGLLLNFWATWCIPCVAELPGLIETRHAFQSRGGEVLLVSYDLMIPGVTRDGVRAKVEKFVAGRKIDAPVLIFEADNYDAINERFELPGEVPVTLAIDRKGRIVDRQDGQADKTRLAEMMERALAH
jgi:thiol-disulfide isomerase/thioredoxin